MCRLIEVQDVFAGLHRLLSAEWIVEMLLLIKRNFILKGAFIYNLTSGLDQSYSRSRLHEL
jgi:hypothetical protein